MSLEQNIAELNTNIKALIAAMAARSTLADQVLNQASDAIKEVTAEVTGKVGKSKAEGEVKKTAATGAQSTGTTKESTASDAAAATGASTGEATPTYDFVKFKILTLSKEKGRDPTVALMQRYGVSKGPDLKPEQFGRFIADVDAILAGTYDPEASEQTAEESLA